jgi:ATP-binding cassette subfamily C protein CydC
VKQTLWRTLKLAGPIKGWMALAVLLGVATVGSSIGLMALSSYIIAKAALRPSIAELQVAIVGVRFFGIARGVLRYLERLVSHNATFRLLARLRVWFYQALEPLAPARLMQYRSGDLQSRIVADIETLEHIFVRVIAPPAVALAVGVLMWFLLGAFAKDLAVVLVLFMVIGGIGLPFVTQRLSRRAGRSLVAVRSRLNEALVDGVQGNAELLAFGQGGQYLETVRALSQELADAQRRMAWIRGLDGALMGLLVTSATVAAVGLAIPLVREGKLDGVYLAVIALAVMASFEAISPLPQALQYLEASLEASRRLFAIVDARPAVVDSRPSQPEPAAIVAAGSGLRIEHLCFRYGPSEPLALADISFSLPAGSSIAIVGPSGAGKSTLINLLLRFWEYQDGHVFLDDKELRTLDQESVRQRFGVVSQRTHLFNATIRENLLLARQDASDADLEWAIRRAQLHTFIESLPEGYETWIGEQGLLLSSGQRRRLAIARALLKDAPFLILDEATADLDPLTEQEIVNDIHASLVGRTTLWITHRLVGLDKVDEILVLQEGGVVEQGRHHDLIQLGGLYRRMWDLQSQVLVNTLTG